MKVTTLHSVPKALWTNYYLVSFPNGRDEQEHQFFGNGLKSFEFLSIKRKVNENKCLFSSTRIGTCFHCASKCIMHILKYQEISNHLTCVRFFSEVVLVIALAVASANPERERRSLALGLPGSVLLGGALPGLAIAAPLAPSAAILGPAALPAAVVGPAAGAAAIVGPSAGATAVVGPSAGAAAVLGPAAAPAAVLGPAVGSAALLGPSAELFSKYFKYLKFDRRMCRADLWSFGNCVGVRTLVESQSQPLDSVSEANDNTNDLSRESASGYSLMALQLGLFKI
ncbi:hypothetical protein E2986_11009 [Frieseomelitta varia]|uniref:Uncharacterized protein n=1 Tax=Frieseomelitta varia TaxID=561572 RepID=A0A833R539_9HYME|nr:hypothetical protein E2986_11009 [Frieseomelitta varia]